MFIRNIAYIITCCQGNAQKDNENQHDMTSVENPAQMGFDTVETPAVPFYQQLCTTNGTALTCTYVMSFMTSVWRQNVATKITSLSISFVIFTS